MGDPASLARTRTDVSWSLARVAERIGWNRAYRALGYLRSALWVAPIISVLLALVLIGALRLLDRFVTWDLTGLNVAGACATRTSTPDGSPRASSYRPLRHPRR